MRRAVLRTAILVGISSALLGGCAVNETASVTVQNDGTTQQILESNSGMLSSSLSIADTKTGYVGDLLKIQASIKNESRSALNFQYKFKWLDKSGFEVATDGSPWTPLTITPYESRTIQGVAPNPSVNSYKILVQD